MKDVVSLLLSLLLISRGTSISISPERKTLSRRSTLARVTSLSSWFLFQEEALAVKEKNEALCATGFFTNIWQYKCTELGDIEDEGQVKGLSEKEMDAADSLMAKFNLDDSKANENEQEKAAVTSTSEVAKSLKK